MMKEEGRPSASAGFGGWQNETKTLEWWWERVDGGKKNDNGSFRCSEIAPLVVATCSSSAIHILFIFALDDVNIKKHLPQLVASQERRETAVWTTVEQMKKVCRCHRLLFMASVCLFLFQTRTAPHLSHIFCFLDAKEEAAQRDVPWDFSGRLLI